MSSKKKSVQAGPLPFEIMEQASVCLRTIAHPHRLRVIELLLYGDHSVQELADECGIASHQMSEHLGLLKAHGLLTSQRDGRRVYYSVAEPALAGILECIRRHFTT